MANMVRASKQPAKRVNKPAKTVKQAKPAKTVKQTKPAKTVKPAKPAKTVKPAKPAKTKPAKPKQPRPVQAAGPGAAAIAPAPMFQKIAFTMFSVNDPTRARAFYEDVLGLTRGLAAPDGAWTEYDLPGGGCLALFKHPDPAFATPPGGASVAFEVGDLDALVARLTAAGVAFEGGEIKGPSCRMWSLRDSEGNGLILHQLANR